MRCVSHTGYLAHENCKSEIRGRSRHNNNCNRDAKTMRGRNLGTISEGNPKEDLTSSPRESLFLLYHA